MCLKNFLFILASWAASVKSQPLVKRAFSLTLGGFRARLAIAHSVAWVGAAVTLCAMSPTSAACWVSLAIAAFSSADGQIAWDSSTGGSTVDNMAKRDVLVTKMGHVFYNTTSEYDLSLLNNHPTIHFAHTYEMFLPNANVTQAKKRDGTGNAAVYFKTDFGGHMAIALPHIDTNGLLDLIAAATPGSMSVSSTLVKRDEFSVD